MFFRCLRGKVKASKFRLRLHSVRFTQQNAKVKKLKMVKYSVYEDWFWSKVKTLLNVACKSLEQKEDAILGK